MTYGKARRRFWERAFVASLTAPPSTVWWPSGTIQVEPLLTVTPTAAAAAQADAALVEWERRFVRDACADCNGAGVLPGGDDCARCHATGAEPATAPP